MSLPRGREREELASLLNELTRAVEDLALSGLGAASDKTRQTLAVSFQRASARKLLRLGSTLRVAVEEIGRYTKNDPDFSRSRYSFFVNRAWMLSRGLADALEKEDEAQWKRLTWSPGGRTVDALELVCLGVLKRVVPNAFVAFEFRLRTLKAAAGLEPGTPITWSTIFPLRPEADVPPEAYLHLPQKQKFKAAELLPPNVVGAGPVELADDLRMRFRDDTVVTRREDRFEGWEELLHWDPAVALERIEKHAPGPLDLDVELSEEVVLRGWRIGEVEEQDREQKLLYRIEAPDGVYHAPVGTGPEHAALRSSLDKWRGKKKCPPLFGVLHYAACRFMLEPLTIFGKEPEPLMLSKQNFDPAALVRALKYT